MKYKTLAFVLACVMGTSACGTSSEEEKAGAAPMSKEDARNAGKADQDTDFCALFGMDAFGLCYRGWTRVRM